MKRLGFALSFLFLFTASFPLTAAKLTHSHVIIASTELPWSTVDAVLKKVAERGTYAYSQLVNWYDQGWLTVEPCGSGYLVTISDEDGIVDVLLEESI